MANWYFPAVAGGNINSINNAGLETFRDNPIDSLAREICQNSLDAVMDRKQPVIVEFNNFISSAFPGREKLIESFKKGESTWIGKNKKSVQFIKTALDILANEEIEFLRISDFNTLGLTGAKESKLGSPWSSLIKEAGSSNKNDDSGGSFGIGKAAPFLSSNLRTLVYSSYDSEGYKSHIGVADIMSFQKEDNKVTLGKGYFTNNEDSTAIEGLLNLDPSFQRLEMGTDIYVASFTKTEDWKKEMIESVLRNFFVTVYQKQLIVRVDGFEINHKNISELVGQLEDNDDNQILKNYFKLFTSPQTIRIPYPKKNYKDGIVFQEGEAELLLMEGEDLNRRVLMTRKNGMRIYEQSNISGTISFTGLLVMKGKNMNKIFKEMENPAHNIWLPNRFENPKLAEKIFADLRRFLRETVKETFQQNTSDTMNAIGLSDFLPNKSLLGEQGRDKMESIQPHVKSIASKDIEQRTSKDYQSTGNDTSNSEERMFGEFGISPDEQRGNGTGEAGSSGSSGRGTNGEGGKDDVDLDIEGNARVKEKEIKNSVSVSSQQKYACADKKGGQYRFAIVPSKGIIKGHLNFKVIGEQNDFDLPIKQAEFIDSNILVEKITSNMIYFTATEKTTNLNINVKVDYSDYCVMEVGVYEDQ
jgi:hypothetical protein